MIRYHIPTLSDHDPIPARLRAAGPWDRELRHGAPGLFLTLRGLPCDGPPIATGTTGEGWTWQAYRLDHPRALLHPDVGEPCQWVELHHGWSVPIRPVRLSPRRFASSGARTSYATRYADLAQRLATLTDAEMAELCLCALQTGLRLTAEIWDALDLITDADVGSILEAVIGDPKPQPGASCADSSPQATAPALP